MAPKLTLDLTDAEKILKSLIPNLIKERVAKGFDKNGNRFVDYSDGYKDQLERMGNNTNVDLLLTGGFLADIKTLSVKRNKGYLELHVGAGSATSATVTPPPIEYKKNGEEKKSRPRMVKTGKHGPSHNQLGRWMQEGANGPKREWLGLTKQQWAEIKAQVIKSKILKLK